MQHISLYIKGTPAELLRRLAWESYLKGELSQEGYIKRIKEINKK